MKWLGIHSVLALEVPFLMLTCFESEEEDAMRSEAHTECQDAGSLLYAIKETCSMDCIHSPLRRLLHQKYFEDHTPGQFWESMPYRLFQTQPTDPNI